MARIEVVRLYALHGYLTSKQKMSKRDAKRYSSGIWSILVTNNSYSNNGRLPLRLFCTICGKEYGICRDNWQSDYTPQGRYMPKQLLNWAIGRTSLVRCYPIIETEEFRQLGAPGGSSQNRKYLLAWINHLRQ